MIGRDGCQYKSKNNGFNKGIGNMKWYKVQLNTSNVIVQSTKTSINTGSHPSNNPQTWQWKLQKDTASKQ